ncbi:MAG: hypothetical protein K0S75_2147 [Clostridia bacterium]|jgi:uncharacterized protein YaaR (DUF327 family)|nr:hypothetical protein [Clostridia bacterium]
MKISDIVSHPTAIPGLTSKEERRNEMNPNKATFADALQRKGEEDLDTRLNKLMSQINFQGEQLGKNMDIKELKNYKRLITEFMDEVVNSSLKYSKHNQFDRRGRHKVYAMVKKVNARVEELSREFLKEEKDNIKILESIGTIKGMLLDIYM